MASPHVGDVGVLIRLTVRQDGAAMNISSALTKQIKIYKPSGEAVTRTGSFTTDGTDGKLEAVTESSDLDEVGKYRAVAYLAIGSWSGHSSAGMFNVLAVGE